MTSVPPAEQQASHLEDTGNAGRPDGETWVALLHRPGPAAPREGSVFKDPRFTEHIAFLARMRERPATWSPPGR